MCHNVLLHGIYTKCWAAEIRALITVINFININSHIRMLYINTEVLGYIIEWVELSLRS